VTRRSIPFYYNRTLHHIRSGGFTKLFSIVLKKLAKILPPSLRPNLIASSLSELSFISQFPETLALKATAGIPNPKSLDLHWLIPVFSEGSGGHMTIFRVIQFLEKFGHKNTVWLYEPSKYATETDARQAIREQFLPIDAKVRFLNGNPSLIEGDAVIATHWWSAYHARAVTRVRERFYFVQDFEPSFYPMGSEYLLAENTYRFGYTCICASRWLKSLMSERFKSRSFSFDLAYDPKFYFADPSKKRAANRVAFYARVTTERRAVELGMLALQEVAKKIPLHVDFFGYPVGKLDVPYSYKDHGILNHTELATLYREATVGLVFSATNYSLIPQEMMACGLPVIDLDGENTRGAYPADTVTLAKADPVEIAAKITELLTQESARVEATTCGLNSVQKLSWEKSAKAIEAALVETLSPR